eukprot:2624293-Pleurochrysis_carterae.AAC.1
MTIATAVKAAKVAMIDAAGASMDRLNRPAAKTGAVKMQTATASAEVTTAAEAMAAMSMKQTATEESSQQLVQVAARMRTAMVLTASASYDPRNAAMCATAKSAVAAEARFQQGGSVCT